MNRSEIQETLWLCCTPKLIIECVWTVRFVHVAPVTCSWVYLAGVATMVSSPPCLVWNENKRQVRHQIVIRETHAYHPCLRLFYGVHAAVADYAGGVKCEEFMFREGLSFASPFHHFSACNKKQRGPSIKEIQFLHLFFSLSFPPCSLSPLLPSLISSPLTRTFSPFVYVSAFLFSITPMYPLSLTVYNRDISMM